MGLIVPAGTGPLLATARVLLPPSLSSFKFYGLREEQFAVRSKKLDFASAEQAHCSLSHSSPTPQPPLQPPATSNSPSTPLPPVFHCVLSPLSLTPRGQAPPAGARSSSFENAYGAVDQTL